MNTLLYTVPSPISRSVTFCIMTEIKKPICFVYVRWISTPQNLGRKIKLSQPLHPNRFPIGIAFIDGALQTSLRQPRVRDEQIP